MFDELRGYKNHDHFFFKKGDNLNLLSKNVPDMQGVYYIVRLAGDNVDLVYIGKSGTMQKDGTFKEQGLRGRLNNKQDGMPRQAFFNAKCEEEKIKWLEIYWFVTFDHIHQHLPGYVEGLIMQRFFEIHQRLPEWNNYF